ncbi:MAG: glycosyltransferase [Phycisphaerae bacterium]
MRILTLAHPGTNSRGLLLDLEAGFAALGHDLLRFELAPFWRAAAGDAARDATAKQLLAETLLAFIDANRVDLSFAMWANGPLSMPVHPSAPDRVQSLFARARHRHLHFWWDAPHWQNNGAMLPLLRTGLFDAPTAFHAINNRYTGAEMADILGFSNVIPAANAANPALFRPCPDVAEAYDLVFVSGGGDPAPTPLMLAELQRDTPDVDAIRRNCAAELAPTLDALAAQFPSDHRAAARRLFDALVAARLAARHTPALLHLQQVARSQRDLATVAALLLKDPVAYVRVTAAIRQIEAWERPFTVAYLSRRFRCLRIGAQDYSAWGLAGDAVAAVPYAEQARLYAQARVALNVMRWQDDCSLNSKIFEITAAGRPCLQAWRGGVDELFADGREIVTFRSPAEAADQLADLLANPGRRAELAAAGRARTLRDHTWQQRGAQLLDAITAATAARERSATAQPRESAAPAHTLASATAAVSTRSTARASLTH